MPIQSPAKDLRKTSAGALFGQGREMGSAQPTERPSQGLCSDRGAKRSQNSPPKDLEKPFEGRCAVADPTSRYSGASGQKNKGEHPHNGCSPCSENGHLHATGGSARVCEGYARTQHVPCDSVVVTDEHHTNCNTRSPRKIRSCRNRGPPCGNQSEPAESRR